MSDLREKVRHAMEAEAARQSLPFASAAIRLEDWSRKGADPGTVAMARAVLDTIDEHESWKRRGSGG